MLTVPYFLIWVVIMQIVIVYIKLCFYVLGMFLKVCCISHIFKKPLHVSVESIFINLWISLSKFKWMNKN